MEGYLFTSARLGFRTWTDSDLDTFARINADPEIMHFFEKLLAREESKAKMDQMNQVFEKEGFCYFAVDYLQTGELVGTLGLNRKNFPASFTPCVDIGWRFDKKFWNQGLASEGAAACLDYAKKIGLQEVYSYASSANTASRRVMEKIGMWFLEEFEHQELLHCPQLQPFSVYKIQF
ncbi:MAG: GNAT family N-acetyltransferase [Algoriphagus sp.]|uniref:GNAT family N-acetyltransferase n=1 Tax=Algoriphagus sp. TaxID=1872435 RepID=UPI001821F922|nr:GNAT family N-acetyltransferase [Algoriphagus sp.]NVJ85743.1 GNAT family N-acetyltransferase [Algoriphagus sp.]